MKKLILLSMMSAGLALALCVSAEETTKTTAPTSCTGKSVKQKCDPAKLVSKIDTCVKKLEAKKAKVTSAGRTDAVASIDKLISALNNLKAAINSKDRTAIKTAREQVQSARAALKALKKEHNKSEKQES